MAYTPKKALLIAISYQNSPDLGLNPVCRDVRALKELLIGQYGYREDDVVILLDDGQHKSPTRRNILAETENLVEEAQPGDHIFFRFTGHSVQQPDNVNLDAGDCILPLDHDTVGGIPARDLQFQFNRIPQKCALTAIFCCCHSGTILDLASETSAEDTHTRSKLDGPHLVDVSTSPLSRSDRAIPLSISPCACKYSSSDHVSNVKNISNIEGELRERLSQSLKTEKRLKNAIFAGAAGGLFSGSHFVEKSSDKHTMLMNAVETLDWAALLYPTSTIISSALGILKAALRDLKRQKQQIFHLAKEVASLVQLVMSREFSTTVINEKSKGNAFLSTRPDSEILISLELLLQDIRKFIERTCTRNFIQSVLSTSEDRDIYDSLCQKLHVMFEKISKQAVRGTVVGKMELETLFKRLKQSSHITACNSVALSFISDRKRSGFDNFSLRLLSAIIKDIRAIPTPSSASYTGQVSLYHNRTLFDEPSLHALISTFEEPSRRITNAAANKARQKVVMTSSYTLANGTRVLAGPLRWGGEKIFRPPCDL